MKAPRKEAVSLGEADALKPQEPAFRRLVRLWPGPALVVLLVGGLVYYTARPEVVPKPSGESAAADLREARATRGVFKDAVAVRGEVVPKRTVYIDAPAGGRIEKVFVRAGAQVVGGQPLVEIANPQLQLDTLSREADVQQQINNLSQTRLTYEESLASYSRQLIENEFQIRAAKRQLAQLSALSKNDMVRRGDLEAARDDIERLTQTRSVLQATESKLRALRADQLKELEAATARLKAGLALARQGVESLTIKAPTDGLLSSLEAEPGQMKALGTRLGQIDDPKEIKVVAYIDEFYLTRVKVGATAVVRVGSKETRAAVANVSTVVKDGRFPIELESRDLLKQDLSRGQSVQVDLQLGEASTALLLPVGPYLTDGASRWVYVVRSDQRLEKRPVSIGRRNSQYVEVLSGVVEGERVVVSSYRGLNDGGP